MVHNLTKTLRDMAAFIDSVMGVPVAVATNDAGERIETLRFSVPALRVGVLEYAPGQLRTEIPELKNKTVLLYYPPESVSDPEFLKSLENSPVVLGGHNQSTNEQDKKIDGWLRTVKYDPTEKAAMVDGVVKGAREADYIRSRFRKPDFGASALIDIMGIKLEDGTTPDGQPYNAVAGKLLATHLTLAPSVRDPENKIEIVNAVVVNSRGTMAGKSNTIEIQNTEKRMTPEEIAAIAAKAAREVVTAKNAEDEMASLKNEMGELKNAIAEMAKNMVKNNHKEPDGDEAKPAENADAEEKAAAKGENADEPATIENTKPAQKLVAAFASAYNADFGRRTPSFETLAVLAGISESDPAARIAAVNAKFSELEGAKATATNTVAGKASTAGSVF